MPLFTILAYKTKPTLLVLTHNQVHTPHLSTSEAHSVLSLSSLVAATLNPAALTDCTPVSAAHLPLPCTGLQLLFFFVSFLASRPHQLFIQPRQTAPLVETSSSFALRPGALLPLEAASSTISLVALVLQ
jgi:hypothetical protein